jgi:hypothetical protein
MSELRIEYAAFGIDEDGTRECEYCGLVLEHALGAADSLRAESPPFAEVVVLRRSIEIGDWEPIP